MIMRLSAHIGALLLIAVAAASAAPSSSDASMLGRTFASTLPGDADDEVAFISIGDWGCGANSQAQAQVARQMQVYAEKLNVSFFISLGDQFYPTGVKSVHDPLWRSTFEDVYAAPAFQRRWYIVGGNHDDYQNASAQIEYTKHSSRWFFPHFYYSETLFREEDAAHTAASHQSRTLKPDESSLSPSSSSSAAEGDSSQQPLPPSPPARKLHPLIDMIFLDSQMLVGPGGDTAQYRWFADAVDASDADFLLVVSHYPVFSGGSHGNTPALLEYIKPIIDTYKASAFLSGHDHILQHLRDSSSDVHYIGSGTGCKSSSRATILPQTLFVSKAHGFVLHRVRHGVMTMDFVDDLGAVLHSITVPARPEK